jgi:hypothetical protein
MQRLPKPQFIIFTDLAQNIHDEGAYGYERKRALNLLEEWKNQYRGMDFSSSEAVQILALTEVLELAIKITQEAFIPPWERN